MSARASPRRWPTFPACASSSSRTPSIACCPTPSCTSRRTGSVPRATPCRWRWPRASRTSTCSRARIRAATSTRSPSARSTCSRATRRSSPRGCGTSSPGAPALLDEVASDRSRADVPRMAVRRRGSGPDLVLFHGGMGSWKHWIRNIEPLSTRFTMHALDHPSYGDSAPVPRETTGPAYLDLVHGLFLEMFPGSAPLRLAGFSFGGAIAASLARRLVPRVTHLCLVSPGGFPSRRFAERPTRSYRDAGDNEKLFREVCRHNLLVNMLSDPASVTEEAVEIQAECVRRARFDSRKVSGGGTLLGDLAQLSRRETGCRVRLLWGVRDDSPFRPSNLLIGEIREAVGTPDVHRIPAAGHWSAYENAAEVNRLMLEFFSS